MLSQGKYFDAINCFLLIPEHEKDPKLCAKIGHCYFKQKRLMKAFKELKKIPKEVLETEQFKEAKIEFNKLRLFYLASISEF